MRASNKSRVFIGAVKGDHMEIATRLDLSLDELNGIMKLSGLPSQPDQMSCIHQMRSSWGLECSKNERVDAYSHGFRGHRRIVSEFNRENKKYAFIGACEGDRHKIVADLIKTIDIETMGLGLVIACKRGKETSVIRLLTYGHRRVHLTSELIGSAVEQGHILINHMIRMREPCASGDMTIVDRAIDDDSDIDANDGFSGGCEGGYPAIMRKMWTLGANRCQCGQPIGSHHLDDDP